MNEVFASELGFSSAALPANSAHVLHEAEKGRRTCVFNVGIFVQYPAGDPLCNLET